MPTISVIIPAYNSGPYLDEAVRSVIAQTFPDWECIVVDDGSTEDLSRVEKMDPRVRLIRQPNRGVSAARNNGMLRSIGEYIAFLDHDDVWLPGKLEKHVSVFRADPTIGLSHTSFDLIDAEGKRVGPGWVSPMEGYLEMLSRGCPLPSMAAIRRECVGAAGLFDPFHPMVQDMDFFLRVAFYFGVKFIPAVESLYRLHRGNASRDYMRGYREILCIVRKHAATAEARGDIPALAAAWQLKRSRRNIAGALAYDAARESIRSRDYPRAAGHLARSLVMAPSLATASLAKYAASVATRSDRTGGQPGPRD